MKQKDVLHVVGLLMYLSTVIAVPVSRHTRDVFQGNSSSLAADECVSEDIIYKAGDEVPSPGPCEQCLCQPPKVECTMIKCKTNSGCKMIQRANHCCPDYMCDCEYKGRVYNNGERLELEDTPCQVCYCKGGEIMCTSITCYERTDCQPKYVPGQCCPRYDHCPLETNGNSSGNSTIVGSKREIQPWLMTNAVTVKPIDVLKQTTIRQPEDHTPPNVYPQTLKIHEILPTTAKYERFPNGKRPVLSAVSKTPQEVYLNEKATAALETSTVETGDNISIEPELVTAVPDEKPTSPPHYSMSTLNSAVQASSSDEFLYSTTIINNGDGSTTNKASDKLELSEAPAEYSTTVNAELMTTEYSQPSFSYESVPKGDGLAEEIEPKEYLVDAGTTIADGTAAEVDDWERMASTVNEAFSTQDSQPSTESVRIRDVSSEGGFTNSIVINEGLTPTINTLTTFDDQESSPAFDSNSENIETIDPTSSSFTQQMGSLVLEGGVYDELNDTILYNDDNFVKQEENTENGESESITTISADNDSREKVKYEPSTSALSEVYEKFVESPDSTSIRRSDDWLSDNYQMFPEDGAEDTDESLLDLNVGATSHSNTRVSPSYYFTSDSKDNYVLNGRSLAPSILKISKENLDKDVSVANKFHSDLNRLVTEESFFNEGSQTLESKLADAISIKLNPDEQSDLYLSITGKNSSSNETILHMILSPSDLKHLAEQLVKENIKSHRGSGLKETEVKLEWLTKEQLSQINSRNSPSTFNVNLANCNLTALADLKSEKNKVSDEVNMELNNFQSDMSSYTSEYGTTESTTPEIELGTSNVTTEEIADVSTTSYSSYGESAELQNVTESVTANDTSNASTVATPRAKKQNMDIETSTIKIYEIRPTGDISDRIIEALVTTEGPYTSDKMTSRSENSGDKVSQSYLPDNAEITRVSSSNEENATENDFETTTPSSRTSEKSRKKNIPNVEPFLRQLPSTLDEKDVSILRDFLERHLSEPHDR